MKSVNPIYDRMGTTIFQAMNDLARQHDAINLGQGFPDDNGPEDLRQAAADALMNGWNQYPPMTGIPDLRQAMARHEKRFYGLDLDWARETLVTSGATEALICAVLALVDTGDEVVLFQPFYDAYPPMVQRAGGVPRVVTLRPPHWTFTREDLARAFGPRTKAVILNNPLNPAGKVYSAAELALIAEFVEASDAYVIADEVYEHLVYDGLTHIPFNTLPGMFERTVKISSAGKMFSLTGWKIGLVTAQADLLVPVLKAHQFLTFTTPPNLQAAVALGLDKEDGYFDGLAARMQAGRDHLVAGFRGMGIATHDCAGTYFVNIDIGSTGFNGDDVAFCRHLTEAAKVAAIPVSAFCSETPITDTARFAFCKSTATLDAALDRMRAHFG
ncbi:MAG: aminotransferase [Sneathiellaceae bacterium]